ncbi:MAG TPA: DUF4878 domain-containing protein [Pyrinomonadaceae bacterium]|nr:DUF4878 domain-containing protein [Acidobacteriota bacterium]HQZ95940.1 DUF4878 domain-containing protein [Pyrinomonadaceae bacterium]
MRNWSRLLIFALAISIVACTPQRPATPKETFMTYIKALKAKDYTTMKLLLSDATIKMHEKEAKAQGVTVDDIVKRETLLSENQTSMDIRNEKVDGDKASLQVKNSYGSWETVPFVREDGVWKIDKQGYADQMLKDIEDQEKELDELINGNRSTY